MNAPPLDRQQEAQRILQIYGQQGFEPAMVMLERQFTVLHNRAQVLLGLCGIVVTTTGFSGRIIAGTNLTAQICIIVGVALALLAAVVVAWGVLHLRWLTMQPGDNLDQWLRTALAYRDRKTTAYRAGLTILLAGLAVYVISIAVMLANPLESNLAPR